MAIEGYTTIEAIALYSDDRNWISGGDPILPDGQDDGRYDLFWKYDPTGATGSGITGISWYGMNGGPYSGADEDINQMLSNELQSIHNGSLESLKGDIDADFSAWNTRSTLMNYLQDNDLLDILRSAGCFSW